MTQTPYYLYKSNAIANLPSGMTYDSNTARFVVNNKKFFTYLEANTYLEYLIKFGFSAGPPAFDPATLFASGENGFVWLPSPTTCFANADGTGAVAVGDAAGYQTDTSGSGINGTQSTAGAKPSLQQTVGGLYYLAYDGVADYLEANGLAAIATGDDTPFTIVSATDFTRGGFNEGIWGFGSSTTPALWEGFATSESTYRPLNATDDAGGTYSLASTETVEGVCVRTETYTGTNVVYRKNGTELINTPAALGVKTLDRFIWGGTPRGGTPQRFTNQKFYGAVAIDRVLTAEETTALENYLAGISGVTL